MRSAMSDDMHTTPAPAPEVIKSITDALATWDSQDGGRIGQAEDLRQQFIEQFPIRSWPELPLESYALGQQTDGGTVCWWMEWKTKPIASMSGGSAAKHLIYLRKKGQTWRYPKEYASVGDAWAAVRSGFVEAFALAAGGEFDEADDINALRGAHALRTKLLYVYFPNDLLPVTSKAHVDHFLERLGQPASSWSVIRANRQLLTALRSIPALQPLSTLQLGFFLYHWAAPRTSVRVFKIAPGELAAKWRDCLQGGFICIGWDLVGDLSDYDSKESFREAFREQYPYNGNEAQVSRKANELWTLMELEAGDKVIANRGTSDVLAIGTVNDDGYAWRPERNEYRHTLGVDWDTSFARKIEPVKAWATTTVSKVSAALFKKISVEGSGDNIEPIPPVSVEVDPVYAELEQALRRRGQAILYGPPGTGKTYTARRAAVWLLDGGFSNPNAAAVLGDDDAFAERERDLSSGSAQAQRVWFMVANPVQWSRAELFEGGTVDYGLGRLQRNFARARAGDLVIVYESTPTNAVVALARITTEYEQGASPESALSLEPVARVNNGFAYKELRADPILCRSEPARFRCQGRLFALTTVEAERLLGSLGERNPELAAISGPGPRRLTRVTFHPSYTYEDFIEGFRPVASATVAGLQLELADGIFKDVCRTAAADPSNDHVLLIDEINRGNIPKVFGELITLIEKDKRGLHALLPQSGEMFAVPPNLLLVGTMNTADRSIHLLDSALRRRFAFVELLPDPQLLSGATAGVLALDVFLDALNQRVRDRVGREKQVGHALFYDGATVLDTSEAFAAVFRHELLPLLQEYLFEDYNELASVLGPVIDVTSQRPSADTDDPETLCALLADHFSAHAST
jgi:5-methylcytosine-specific restriction protein B